MTEVLTVGLPGEIGQWLEGRLGQVRVESAYGDDQPLDRLAGRSWSLLVVDEPDGGPRIEDVLRQVLSRVAGTPPVLCCVDPTVGSQVRQRLIRDFGVRELLDHPLDRDQLALHAASILRVPLRRQGGDPPGQQLRAVVADVWARHRGAVMDQVDVIERGVERLGVEGVDEEQWRAVRRHAHNLAGSIGMFGFSRGSDIARQLDEGLRDTNPTAPGDTGRLLQLAVQLRQELEASPS